MALINGVASGDTTQKSTILWARSNILGDVTFEYATDPKFKTILGQTTASVTDTPLPIKVAITKLQPGTEYYYRVTDAEGDPERDISHTCTQVVLSWVNLWCRW